MPELTYKLPTKERTNGVFYFLDDFVTEFAQGSILPSDGCIGEIRIDGYITNAVLRDWDCTWRNENSVVFNTLYDLSQLDGYIEIVWCNK
jgi:hypothetical protein